MSYQSQDKQTRRSLENSYAPPGVRESRNENRSAILLSLAIVLVMLLVIAVDHTGF